MSRKNMSLTKFAIDGGPHNMDGLRLLARDGAEPVSYTHLTLPTIYSV